MTIEDENRFRLRSVAVFHHSKRSETRKNGPRRTSGSYRCRFLVRPGDDFDKRRRPSLTFLRARLSPSFTLSTTTRGTPRAGQRVHVVVVGRGNVVSSPSRAGSGLARIGIKTVANARRVCKTFAALVRRGGRLCCGLVVTVVFARASDVTRKYWLLTNL